MQPGDLLERIRHCAMPVGAVECRGTWLRQQGEMRFAPGRPWMPFKAEQWFRGGSIEFNWQAWVRMAPFTRARAIDSFERGRGRLTALVFGIVPVASSRGPAPDKGEAIPRSGGTSVAPVRFSRDAPAQMGDNGDRQTACHFR